MSGVALDKHMEQEQVLIEKDVPLSGSMIWDRQREFYVERGMKAWNEDRVPNYITNNPFIAEVYAGIVFAFLRDCNGDTYGSSPVKNPLRIVELGAGTGKFAYLFLRSLIARLQECGIDPSAIRYSMTDCSPDVITGWEANAYLAPYVKMGVLEFKLLEAGAQGLISTPAAAADDSGHGPVVVIANYVLDSLPQDAFVIRDGEISELLVSVSRGQASNKTDNASHLQPWELSYKKASVPSERYPDSEWNRILEHYRAHIPAATIMFPNAALTMLQEYMGGASGRPMLALIGDKGFVHEEDLSRMQGDPALE